MSALTQQIARRAAAVAATATTATSAAKTSSRLVVLRGSRHFSPTPVPAQVSLRRFFGTHLTAEQEAARTAAVNLRKSRGMVERHALDPLEGQPWLKPRPAEAAREPWEIPYALFMGAGFAVIALAEFYRPDSGAEEWARDEAETRLERRESGEEIERLHNYAPGTIMSTDVVYQESETLRTAPTRVSTSESDDE